jgi:hypothetical protein
MKDTSTKQEAANLIASAMRDALKTIAQEAQDAKRLIAEDAANAAKVLVVKNADGGSDHDVLLDFRSETRVRLDNLDKGIKEIKDGTATRIDKLEEEKLNIRDSYPILYKAENDRINADHEARLRTIETNVTRIVTWGAAGILVLSIAEFLVSKFL